MSAVSQQLHIGAKNDGTTEANGAMGELAVFAKVLSEEEIKAIKSLMEGNIAIA